MILCIATQVSNITSFLSRVQIYLWIAVLSSSLRLASWAPTRLPWQCGYSFAWTSPSSADWLLPWARARWCQRCAWTEIQDWGQIWVEASFHWQGYPYNLQFLLYCRQFPHFDAIFSCSYMLHQSFRRTCCRDEHRPLCSSWDWCSDQSDKEVQGS